VGLGFIVAFNYSFFSIVDLKGDEGYERYRSYVPTSKNACDYAREGMNPGLSGSASPQAVADLCDRADTLEILEGVSLPLGIALGAIGLVLIGTSDSVKGSANDAQKSAWTADVQAGAQGAGLRLGARF
jgi:hypothetical protein